MAGRGAGGRGCCAPTSRSPARAASVCPASPCTLPSRAAYAAAFTAFARAGRRSRTFTAWNEANHSSQPTAGRPDAAAAYYDESVRACPSCTIVAGDVLDAGDFISWLREFQSATTTNPQLWGVHNYGDVTYGQTSGTDAVLATVPGRLWVEETGGIVVLRNSRGQVTLRSDESRAASAIDGAFEIAKDRSRIDRVYIYHWRAGAFDRFDAGLVRPDGSTRPSYDSLRRSLGAVAPPAVRHATAIRWTARWANRARTRISLHGACSPVGTTCTGRVRPRLRITPRGRGRTRTWTLTTRTLRTRTTHTVRLDLPRSTRTPRRRARRIRLELRTTVTGVTRARVRTLALPR